MVLLPTVVVRVPVFGADRDKSEYSWRTLDRSQQLGLRKLAAEYGTSDTGLVKV
jgi:hypothetical protein